MGFAPETAIAIVRAGSGNARSVTGSAAGLVHPALALTASHCVPEDPEGLSLHYPWRGELRIVTDVERHPTADLAFLWSRPDDADARLADADVFGELLDDLDKIKRGDEFRAMGFPVEGPDASDQQPVPRMFAGHFQRFFTFEGLSGYRFFAAEMSIAAPAGLSGGPLWTPADPGRLVGIVAANTESYSIIDSYEERRENGRLTERGEIRRQVAYGACVLVSEVLDWISACLDRQY